MDIFKLGDKILALLEAVFGFWNNQICLALETALFTAGKRYARHFVQLTVGSYMLLYLGVISCENMQIEGFWYYLFLGVFEAVTIHYAVAKIFGPLFFNPACSLR